MKHVPVRSCIACRQQKDKSELLRIVRQADGSVVLDVGGKAAGRGAYVCKNGECVYALTKRRALDRAFKQKFSDEVYAAIEADYTKLAENEQTR